MFYLRFNYSNLTFSNTILTRVILELQRTAAGVGSLPSSCPAQSPVPGTTPTGVAIVFIQSVDKSTALLSSAQLLQNPHRELKPQLRSPVLSALAAQQFEVPIL